LGFLLEYRKTKLLILADPHSRAKCAFPSPMVLQGPLAPSLGSAKSARPCSFVRGSNACCVPVTAPIALMLQGLPAEKNAAGRPYHCWRRFCNLTCCLACAESGRDSL